MFAPVRAVRRKTRDERAPLGQTLRLALGFVAIGGFVVAGLCEELGLLETGTYLAIALGLFSLYGAVTFVTDDERKRASVLARTGRVS